MNCLWTSLDRPILGGCLWMTQKPPLEIQNSIVEKTSFEICVTVFCIASYRKPNSSCSKRTAGGFTGLATRNLALGKPSCRNACYTPRPRFVLSVPSASLSLGHSGPPRSLPITPPAAAKWLLHLSCPFSHHTIRKKESLLVSSVERRENFLFPEDLREYSLTS